MHAKFWTKLLPALLVLAVFNGLIYLAAKHSIPHLLLQRLATKGEVRILFLGNSLMESALDLEEMKKTWPGNMPEPFNGALGASDVVEHDLLLHHAMAHHPEIQCVVYGYLDFQLTTPMSSDWPDLRGSRNLGFRLYPGQAIQLYGYDSAWERECFLLTGYFPMVLERSQVWHWAEIGRRSMAQWGMPAEETNRFGRAADFKQLEAASRDDFVKLADQAVADQTPWILPMQDMLQTARKSGLRLVVVEMPVTPDHRERFYNTVSWQAYRAFAEKRLESDGVLYVNASDWVPEAGDFADPVHLKASGAQIFSRKLAAALSSKLQASP